MRLTVAKDFTNFVRKMQIYKKSLVNLIVCIQDMIMSVDKV